MNAKVNYKAVFTDIDGTLVSFKTHKVPQSAIDALQAAHEKGITLIISTGRPFTDLKEVVSLPYDGVISLNGADCRWRYGSVIEQYKIQYDDFLLMQEMSRIYGFAIGLEMDEGIFVSKITPEVLDLAEKIAHPIPEVCNLEKLFLEKGCSQMCAYFDIETQKKVMPHIPNLYASRWHPGFADIDLAGISKGTGLQRFAKELGIEVSQTMAFGDGGNDIPLLQAAGLGIAMGNAGEDVKENADFVTSSVDEDGISSAITRFLL